MINFGLLIEYGSWFECVKLSGLPESELAKEIEKRVDGHVKQLLTVGFKNESEQQVKVNTLKTLQGEKVRNEYRLLWVKDPKNNIANAFEHLIPLGEIHDRIISGVIEKLKKLN